MNLLKVLGGGMESDKKKDYKWFLANREVIINNHIEESVIIRGEKVLGYYANDLEALEAMKDEPKGTFIIQRCIPEERDISLIL